MNRQIILGSYQIIKEYESLKAVDKDLMVQNCVLKFSLPTTKNSSFSYDLSTKKKNLYKLDIPLTNSSQF